eukprot:scaffold38944_cov63-Phaeocystis_antarctica.AAC.4
MLTNTRRSFRYSSPLDGPKRNHPASQEHQHELQPLQEWLARARKDERREPSSAAPADRSPSGAGGASARAAG